MPLITERDEKIVFPVNVKIDNGSRITNITLNSGNYAEIKSIVYEDCKNNKSAVATDATGNVICAYNQHETNEAIDGRNTNTIEE